jgi:membrane-bound serine protease (ClpP class)
MWIIRGLLRVRYNNCNANMPRHNLFLLAFLFTGLILGLAQPVQAQDNGPLVVVLTADGPITPAMAQYLGRGIQLAENQGAEALIVQLNTPGGSIDAMTKIEQVILDSSVPIIVYVAPRGAMAASAGTIVTLAGHAAAMAPEAMIGAASPVGSQGEDLPTTEELKAKNALAATARSLTERRGASAQALAQDTIMSAAAASSTEALQAGLIDFVASDLNELLSKLDGFTVSVRGQPVTLRTANARLQTINISLIEELLLIVTDPNIVFLLITIGVQAIIIEISSPGGWIAGFIGVVCMGLATYGLGILSVNWFGLLFILTSFVLFFLDIKAPTHGGLTAAGIGSLIVGALVLFNTPVTPSFQHVSVPLVVGVSLASGAIFFAIMMVAVRAQQTPVAMGEVNLSGQIGIARTSLSPKGSVQIGSELWSAVLEDGTAKLQAGARVEVLRVDGLRLVVRKAE